MNSEKQPYRAPEIVDLGSIESTTTGHDAPVRDNGRADDLTYYNSAKKAPLPRDGESDEVDL